MDFPAHSSSLPFETRIPLFSLVCVCEREREREREKEHQSLTSGDPAGSSFAAELNLADSGE